MARSCFELVAISCERHGIGSRSHYLTEVGNSCLSVVTESGTTMSDQPEETQIAAELGKLAPEIVPILNHVDAAAQLMRWLSKQPKVPEQANYRAWELAALHLFNTGRVHGALGLFWGLYQLMLQAQSSGRRIHKGTPLVRISDCFARLGFRLHAKRYLMLTLCEDALEGRGIVSPETTGVYFRLIWIHGFPDAELERYARTFFQLAQKHPRRSLFPEALLQLVDDSWLTETPTAEEASFYRVNQHYARYALGQLGDAGGRELEILAEYLMSCLPGCRTQRRKRSGSTDYDMICAMEGLELDFRSELGRYFVCECKDWSLPADFTTMAKFCRILDSIKSRFGVLFSKNGITGAGKTRDAERERLKVFQDRGIVIAILGLSDLESVASGANLITLLRKQYETVRLDLIEQKFSA